jgi:hypothetical protein
MSSSVSLPNSVRSAYRCLFEDERLSEEFWPDERRLNEPLEFSQQALACLGGNGKSIREVAELLAPTLCALNVEREENPSSFDLESPGAAYLWCASRALVSPVGGFSWIPFEQFTKLATICDEPAAEAYRKLRDDFMNNETDARRALAILTVEALEAGGTTIHDINELGDVYENLARHSHIPAVAVAKARLDYEHGRHGDDDRAIEALAYVAASGYAPAEVVLKKWVGKKEAKHRVASVRSELSKAGPKSSA